MKLNNIRYLLFPFSILYGGIIWVRNKLFDKKILRSAKFDLPVICVGNLSVGGTGKTPMVEYLINILHDKYKVATLSRGYKRKTKGFIVAHEHTKTSDIGDEPMQFYQKFPEITVAVDEDRVMGIPKVLNDRPETEIIILDDAFQHRQAVAGLNILLTEYNNLYTKDFLLPAGNLRDIKSSSERADIIVVTKCNSNLSEDEINKIINELKPGNHQKVFFTKFEYQQPYHVFTHQILTLRPETDVLLICGIANPEKLINEIKRRVGSVEFIQFKDHYDYTSNDIKNISDQFAKINSENKIIITTEKDAARLLQFRNEIKDLPIFSIPIAHKFLFDQQPNFENAILKFANSFNFAS